MIYIYMIYIYIYIHKMCACICDDSLVVSLGRHTSVTCSCRPTSSNSTQGRGQYVLPVRTPAPHPCSPRHCDGGGGIPNILFPSMRFRRFLRAIHFHHMFHETLHPTPILSKKSRRSESMCPTYLPQVWVWNKYLTVKEYGGRFGKDVCKLSSR